MASSGLTTEEKSFGVESELDPDRGANPRRNGRRRSKANSTSTEAAAQKKKKMPQRGMGVAELERLRLQERHQQASPTSTTHYFLSPFAPDPVPVGAVPVKLPLNNNIPFGSGNNYGFSRQTGAGCNPNGVVPWHYQNMNSKDHHHQLSSIRDSCGFSSSCVKKIKRTNDMGLICWNKSMNGSASDDVGSMNMIKERGDPVMHQFFPIGKKDNVKVRLELSLDNASSAAAGEDDDDDAAVATFKPISSIDLSLKL